MAGTSPPYWALRAYHLDDGEQAAEIGGEKTPEEYLDKLVTIFREVRRVLRPDGVLWLNIGDTYASPGVCGGASPCGDRNGRHSDMARQSVMVRQSGGRSFGVPAGNMCGIPWRLALALQADGWYLRSDCIWHKPSAMPESARDRPNRSHEYVFLLTKSADYYYDWFGVRQEGSTEDMRNLRTVWDINPEPYKGCHFAAFPQKICELMIQAGSSDRGHCRACGAPYVRHVESTRKATRPGRTTKVPGFSAKDGRRLDSYGRDRSNDDDVGNRDPRRHVTMYRDLGFKVSCKCAYPARPPIVLDPFVGSGTLAAVAARMGRYAIGIDISRKYLKLARDRIGDALLGRDSVDFDSSFRLPAIERV